MVDMVYPKYGEGIDVLDLEHNQLGVRLYIFLGEDEDGNYIGDPPNLHVDVCYECYNNFIRGHEDSWNPTMWDKNTVLNGKWVHPQVDEFDLAGRTFEEIFADGEVWEWDEVIGASDVFRESGYHCNECQEELLNACYDIGSGGKDRPTIWHMELNKQVRV